MEKFKVISPTSQREYSDHSNEKNEPTKSLKDPIEREAFVRRNGLLPLVGAIALQTLSVAHEKPAEAAEVTRGMSWQEGVRALHEETRNSPTEQAAYAVVLRDGKVYWTGSKRGGTEEVSTRSDEVLATMSEEVQKGLVEVVCKAHTHPILSAESTALVSPEDARRFNVRASTTFSIPPSGTDVNPYQPGKLSLSGPIADAGGYVVNIVFDPSRVWRHRIATDEDLKKYPAIWKDILTNRDFLPKWSTYFKEKIAKFTEEEVRSIALLLPEDVRTRINRERLVLKYTPEQTAQSRREEIYYALLSGSSDELVAALLKDDEVGRTLQTQMNTLTTKKQADAVAWNDFVYTQWVPASLSGEPSPELHNKLQEAYLNIGTVVESFTYQEIQDDPRKLCVWPDAKDPSRRAPQNK